MANDTATNLPAPMSEAQMRSTAASQIDLEIAQSVAPIQSQITSTQRRETQALGQIGSMFDNLQPVVKQAAAAVQQSYDQATSQEQQVFANAQSTLQTLRGNRAADAQALAQQIGGPVAINEWTKPYDDAAGDLAMLGAGQELHTLAYAQAGVQQANQFSGQVFPLIRTEQMAATRNQFEEQIREYQDQITALKAQKGAQVNKRYNELRTQELQYGIQRAQFNLDKLDSQRNYNLAVKKAKTEKAQADRQFKLDKQDYELRKKTAADNLTVALRNAGNNEKEIALARDRYRLDVRKEDYYEKYTTGELTGMIDGVKTLSQKELDAKIEQDGLANGLRQQEIDLQKEQLRANKVAADKKLKADQKGDWVELLENAVNPKPGATVTETKEVELTPTQALTDPDAYIGADGKYYKIVEQTRTLPGMTAITDPTQLVDYLETAAAQMTHKQAVDLVTARLGSILPDGWKYGDKWPPKKEQGKPGPAGDFNIGKYLDSLTKGTVGDPNLYKPGAGAGAGGSGGGTGGGTTDTSGGQPGKPTSRYDASKDPITAPGPQGTGSHLTKKGYWVNDYGNYMGSPPPGVKKVKGNWVDSNGKVIGKAPR